MRIYRDNMLYLLDELIIKIKDENKKQVNKWGIQERSIFEWMTYLTEEVGELAQAISEYEYRGSSKGNIIKESIQTVTLALKIAEFYLEEMENNEKR